ncbi:hypothetical protein DXG03_004608 [Asterophora parasitica]|uniref:Rad4-domain-containing protein n=1 Tax=Asterophora parasitica TaxID=117018 RepID=A0A9P7KFM0_9AGAR|nr:hypothetical protein DXG03_004608 [Asterophora parasitica]
MAPLSENDPFTEQDSEDDFDWEEVEVPEHQQQEEHIEITIPAPGTRPKSDVASKSVFKGISHAERLRRIDCHKIHTVVLLGNAWGRNKWLNDELLHARLLSVTPMALQNAFAMIHKSRVPDANQRGRMFEAAITNLAEWWSSTYFDVDQGGHIRNRTYDDVQGRLAKLGPPPSDPEAILDIEDVEDLLDDDPELIRSPKSLMKHVLMRNGSRDTSAQLYTALCRGMGIPARLVVSIQSVPWQTNVGKPKPTHSRKPAVKGKRKGKAKESVEDTGEVSEDVSDIASSSRSASEAPGRWKGKDKAFAGEGQRLDGAPLSEKAKGKRKAAPVIKLRKTRSKGNVLGSTPASSRASSSRPVSQDPTTTPPVFWTEVFSRPDGRWIPVDPIRCVVNKRKVFDPTPTTATSSPGPNSPLFPQAYAAALNRRPAHAVANRNVKEENRMLYVLAFEEDGYARDVTRRYAKEFGAKIAKVQGGSSTIGGGGKARHLWWERVVGGVSRPYRLHRDDVEDEELEAAQMMEGMPSTVSGFKDHPLYVLTRHLKQNQVIYPAPPDTPEVGKFRGEPVYPRSSVVSLKTAENWLRSEGRMVKTGCQALKMVKIRSGTINRMRELEVMKDELKEAGASGETMQGLYARNQTEPYRPDPVVDVGKVPKNNFGNIDLYVPSMLPSGAAHVPFKGVAKIARKLGYDYAEAVTGFEFKKRRAFPVIEGVAYWEAEQDAEAKARAKREERVIKQWTRLVQGLRIRQRLQEQYATKPDEVQGSPAGTNDQLVPGSSKDIVVTMSHPGVGAGGGFLIGADDVVQPFHLPKYKFQPSVEPMHIPVGASLPQDENESAAPNEGFDIIMAPTPTGVSNLETMDLDTVSDEDLQEVAIARPTDQSAPFAPPKTMRELAEDAARQQRRGNDGSNSDNVEIIDTDVYRLSPGPTNGRASGSGTPKTKIAPRPLPRPLPVSLKLSGNVMSTPGSSGSASPAPTARTPKSRAPARRASTRGKSKKRARDRDTDDQSSDDDDDNLAPSSKKRATNAAKASVAAPAPSTRTLRPRGSKTPAQLKEAQELEEAYRRAIGH